jgi:hypothetical protein
MRRASSNDASDSLALCGVISTRRASSAWLTPGSRASHASMLNWRGLMPALRPRFFGPCRTLHTYASRWNALNVLRMALVAATLAYLFQAFLKLDRQASR